MGKIDYLEAGVTEPEPGLIQFQVTQEMIDEVRHHHITWSRSSNGDGYISLECSESAAVALQIFLQTGKFKVGTFRAPKYSQDWKEYRPKSVTPKTKVKEEEPCYAF